MKQKVDVSILKRLLNKFYGQLEKQWRALISIMLVDNTIKIPWRDLYAIIDVKYSPGLIEEPRLSS
jgi:hypothetical protein